MTLPCITGVLRGMCEHMMLILGNSNGDSTLSLNPENSEIILGKTVLGERLEIQMSGHICQLMMRRVLFTCRHLRRLMITGVAFVSAKICLRNR